MLRVFDCHGVSRRRGSGGVCNCTSRQSNTTYALIGTSPAALTAFLQFSSVKTLKNASLKAGRKPFLLMWKTSWRAKSLMHWEYFYFSGKKQITLSGWRMCND